jgi:hypothetical protein
MNTSRFNYEAGADATSPSGPRKDLRWKWIPVSDLSERVLGNLTRSPQNRIFAIVSRPTRSQVEGKTIRRILIFDNHPDSLRLVLESGVGLDNDDAAVRRERRTSIICGFILIAMVVAGMLWSLLW